MTKSKFNLRNVVAIVICLAGTAMLSGCGGGSGSSGSGVKKNDYLGSLPAIYTDMESAKKADKAKTDELREKLVTKNSTDSDFKKFKDETDKIKQQAKERDAKFDAELKDEASKLAGKDIPFTCSEEFNKGNCEVLSVKLSDKPGYIIASVVAKNDFKSDPYMQTYSIYYKVLAKDGSTIADNLCFYLKKKASYSKGEALKTSDDKDAESYMTIYVKPEMWVDFASIEFFGQ